MAGALTDLTALLMKDWERLGPRLQGKLHVTMGTKDTFYLRTRRRTGWKAFWRARSCRVKGRITAAASSSAITSRTVTLAKFPKGCR